MASTGAEAFTQARDEVHPFGIYYDDETPLMETEGRARTEILFSIPEDGYLYRDSLKIECDDPAVAAELALPPPVIKHDEFQGKEVPVYFNELVLPVDFSLSASAPPDEITGTLSYQGCAGRVCYRLMRLKFRFPVAGGATGTGTVRAIPAQGSRAGGDETGFAGLFRLNNLDPLLKRGTPVAVAVSFLAGVLTSFTPCVLPVIPLTLAFMGIGARNGRRLAPLLLFSAGMIAMYAVLGVASASLGKTLGFWFQSRVFQVFLVAFFTLMALWLMGVVNLAIPASWQNAIARVSPPGPWRSLYAGLTVGFLAAPCVGPVVGPLLLYISLSKDIGMGMLLMTSYAAGLSVLFFALSYFSRGWIAGFGEKSAWVKRGLGLALLLVAAFYAYVLVNPYIAAARRADPFFGQSLSEAEVRARGEGKFVLVDFYADWCLPCHEWEKNVWSKKAVRKTISERFVPVKIDCTIETGECSAAVDRFNVIGWPTILFLGPDGIERKDRRIVGAVMGREEFLKHLEGMK